MNREVVFAQTLEQVRKLAKEQGNCVSQEQVREAFGPLKLDEEQFELVFDYLVKHKVGIDQPVNIDDYLSDKERDYLKDYLEELEALPCRSQGEIEALTLSAMAKDSMTSNRQAKQNLVEVYLKDVADIARLYAGQGVLLEDLIGEGNVALAMGIDMLGSLEKPEEAPGMLMKLVMDAMEEYIQENASNEKTDLKVAKQVNKIADKARELADELHRKVTPEELAQETGFSLKSIQEAMRMSGFRIEDIEYAEDSL